MTALASIPRQMLVLAALVAGFHCWNLGGEFVFDDGIYIVLNPAVQEGLANWTRFFTDHTTYAGTTMSHYRPFVALSYAADVAMGLGITGFKITQLIMHLLTTLGVFWVARRLATGLRLDLPGFPFLAAAWFGVMPFNVEAVHYMAARSSVLCGLFAVVAVGLFLELRLNEAPSRPIATSALLYVGHLMALGAALLSKETALTLPGVLFLIDLAIARRRGTPLFGVRFLWPYLPYVAGLALALAKMPNVVWVGHYLEQVFEEEWRFAAAIYCLAANFGMMLVPAGLTLAHPINEAGRLSDPLTLASGAAAAALIGSALATWRRAPWWSLGIGWYFLLIAPSTFVHLNTVLMENRGYSASMGAALAAAGVVATLWRLQAARRVVAVAVVAIALAYFVVGYQRQQVWASSLGVWKDAVAHDPASEEAWTNLGKAHFDRGEWREAESAYRRALEIRPDAALVVGNLAGVYLKLGRPAEALGPLRQLVALEPKNPGYLVNLFHAQSAVGDNEGALATARSLLEAERENAVRRVYPQMLAPGQAATVMVGLALRMGRPDAAAWAIETARATYPDYPLFPLLEMRLYAATRRFDRAEAALAALAEALPGDSRLAAWRRELATYRAATAGGGR